MIPWTETTPTYRRLYLPFGVMIQIRRRRSQAQVQILDAPCGSFHVEPPDPKTGERYQYCDCGLVAGSVHPNGNIYKVHQHMWDTHMAIRMRQR